MSPATRNVLFLCTGNSARSILAECLANRLGEGRIRAWSAGSHPKGQVHPATLEVLRAHGYETSGLRSKSWDEFGRPGAPRFDAIVTVCDQAAAEACPVWPGHPVEAHWSIEDPAAVRGDPSEQRRAFERAYRDLERRIESFARGDGTPPRPKRLNVFERWLSLWVVLCMVVGVALGKLLPALTDGLRRLEFGERSQINVPIAMLLWLMIYPMMLRIDLASVLGVRRRPRGILVTLFVNWLVKPFSMALLGWLFFKHVFHPWIGDPLADQYLAGVIILAAAPCTAMVFVWSYLTDGDPAYTLVQVSLNDLLMLLLFAPIVTLLVTGASDLTVPFEVLVYSVLVFIVVPLALGSVSRALLLRARGADWFESRFLPLFQPVTTAALLATLVLIFAFQAENLTDRFFHVALIAVPILIQVYFNASLAYGLMKLLRVPYAVAAPGALIGASNFFELAVATAIALYGPDSGAALATVVGVLVEVPVMLSVCAFCNRTRHWFP